jgi:dUTP pyrophosphatase
MFDNFNRDFNSLFESVNGTKVKFKKLSPSAVTPTYAKDGDAGLDLTATWKTQEIVDKREVFTYGTGLAFEIPEGYVGLIFPRSSVVKTSTMLANCVGVIDSGYRGEVTFKFVKDTNSPEFTIYSVGDRIGQLIIMPYPTITLEEVAELSSTERGSGGYGSTGVR